MTSSEINEPARGAADLAAGERDKAAFGDVLLRAREARSFTINEVAKATHLGEAVIDAIEQSDLSRLPPPTFVQGYLRTYARYLGLPEQDVVDSFNRAVPYKRESQLQPRASLPSQASSRSPLIRSVSLLLVFLAVLALVYSAYSYYARTARTIGLEQTSSLKLNLSGKDADNGQHAVISEEGELVVVAPVQKDAAESDAQDVTTTTADKAAPATAANAAPTEPAAESVEGAVNEAGSVDDTATMAADANLGNDTIELQSHEDSWVEIVDATDLSLYHDLLRGGQVVHLQGAAPFDVFLGNAPGVELQVNNVEVNMSRYIRNNNVARFSVSTSDGAVVFR